MEIDEETRILLSDVEKFARSTKQNKLLKLCKVARRQFEKEQLAPLELSTRRVR